MAIRVSAEDTGCGVLLRAVGSEEQAERLAASLRKRGFPATSIAFPLLSEFRVFVPALAMEEFGRLASELDIQIQGGATAD